MLTLTPRVLGTFCCVLLLQVLCRMKKLLSGVKRALSSGPSSRSSGSCSGDNGSQNSPRSSSFMPSPHGTAGSSHYVAHDDVPEATNNDDIFIYTIEEMEKYESLCHQEFAHTHPTILRIVGWGKLYDEPRLGSHLLTLEFLITFETVEKNRKPFVKFHLIKKSFGCGFSRFSDLLDFSKSCLSESSVMRNFNKVEFSDAISGKFTRLRFSYIHNPSLRFLHRWMSFMPFSMVELHSIATPELKCLFAMVNRIKYTPIADIVDYFKNVHKMLGPIKCTSMVTQIEMNLGCPKWPTWPTLRGMYLFLFLTILFMRTSCARNPIILYMCCMGARRSGYLTWAFNCPLVKVLHYSLIRWERHTTASQDHLTLVGELIWRQHSRPRLHRRLTLRSPSGTLGTGWLLELP
jgi:hypothetical protein